MKTKYLIFVATLLSLSSIYVNAATYSVTNTNDSGPGSLRVSVIAANTTPDDDVIVFDIPGCPNGVCTITLTSGRIEIGGNGDLIISNASGPGGLIISGNNTGTIFYAVAGSSLSIHGMTFEDSISGSYECAITTEQAGVLIIVNSNLRENSCALVSLGQTKIIDSKINGNGFGIENNGGVLEILRSEISGNSSPGILSYGGFVTVRDSTIANNAGFYGGGVVLTYFYPRLKNSGHAIDFNAVIENSTISGNQASYGGGIFFDEWVVKITNTTVTMNSAENFAGIGAFQGSQLFVRNSIIAGNTTANGPEIVGSLTDLGNNIIGGNPMLGPLADNGGPTRTHSLLAGSPAIDAGNNCVLTANGCGDGNSALSFDQRGHGRVGTVDIGAFEFSAPAALFEVAGRITTATGSSVAKARVSLEDGAGNIRYALTNPFGYFRFQNVAVGPYTVTVMSKRYGSTSSVITVSSSITSLDMVL